jgi:hypothetical protein
MRDSSTPALEVVHTLVIRVGVGDSKRLRPQFWNKSRGLPGARSWCLNMVFECV